MVNYDILWTYEAENDLDVIFEYYFEKSPSAAYNIVNDIINSAETLIFSNQYQVDFFKTNCRRIVVRHYKVLYTIDGNMAYILRVFDSRQNPSKM